MESLDELPAPSHVTVIEHAEKLLADDPDEIKTFLRQLNDIGRYWSTRVGLARDWGSGPVSFNTVLLQIQRAFKDSRTLRRKELALI